MVRVRTAGIDLAAQAKRTGVCVIDWSEGRARVEFMVDTNDDDLANICRMVDKTGVDCPFGWPEPFVQAVQAHASGDKWPGRGQPPDAFRRSLAFRQTDEYVRDSTGCIPLSVTSNFIGLTAMRCALLLDTLVTVDRTGRTGPVAEVYPAATLQCWGFPRRGFKGNAGQALRAEFLMFLADESISLDSEAQERCHESDDAFDALISALTARAVALGRTHPPSPDQELRACTEGWIHMPTARPGALV